MDYRRFPKRWLRHFLGIPFIYSVLLPFLFLDIIIEIYQRICFPLYGLNLVSRKHYMVFDRARLPYLRWWEKIGCLYCSYANGLLAYATEIVARTEKYWCGIKHQPSPDYYEPVHHKDFLAYGDEEGYRNVK